jgi:hypothetical protein
MTGRLTVPALLLMAAGATDLVVWSDGQGPMRIGLSIAFLLLVPGWAILRVVDPPLDIVASIGLAVGISVAVDMAVATGLLYARVWSVGLALGVVTVIVVVAVLLDLPAARHAISGEVRRAWSALSNLDQP